MDTSDKSFCTCFGQLLLAKFNKIEVDIIKIKLFGILFTGSNFLTAFFNPSNSAFLQGRKDFGKLSKPCHVGIHLIALAKYSQMSSHVPRFQSCLRFFASFLLAKVAKYPCAMVSVIFQVFAFIFFWPN